MSRNGLIKDLGDTIFFSFPLYGTLYRAGTPENVFKHVKRMFIPSSAKTVSFKLHVGTLPVKIWMEENIIFVPRCVHCFMCQKSESIEHVLLDH